MENSVHIAVLTMMDMLCPSAQLNQYKMHITFYALVRRYYKHATAGNYKKNIAEIYGQNLSNCFVYYMIIHYLVDSAEDQLNRPFLQYSFSGKPYGVVQKSHGNSKSTKSFVHTTLSTLQKLKDCRKGSYQTPKQAISTVTNQKGGIVNSKRVGDIPRN